MYNEIASIPFDFRKVISGEIFHDTGWVFLNYMFKHIGGFFVLVAVLNILQNIIIYKFIIRNLDVKWRTFAVFIYLFSTNFYLLNFSMMRQGLVVAIFIFAMMFINERRWIIAMLLIWLSTLIHSSAIVLMPFIFWGFFPLNKVKLITISYVLIMVFFAVYSDAVDIILDQVLTYEDFQVYARRYSDNNVGASLSIGYMINLLPLVVSLVYFMQQKADADSERRLVLLSACSFLVLPFSTAISTIGRIGIYFSSIGIVALPIAYSKLRPNYIKFMLIAIFVLITLYDYYLFLTGDVFGNSYAEFHTIFEAI